MRRFRGCQLSCHLLKRPNIIYEDVIDASVNTCYKLTLTYSLIRFVYIHAKGAPARVHFPAT